MAGHGAVWKRPAQLWLAAALVLTLAGPAWAAPADKVFTVSNYPVEARAGDAVAAKAKAISDGQKAALRSLMKRLVPTSAYGQLKRLSAVKAASLVDGFSVRSERNSSTDYIANLDFSFQPQAVRQLLEKEGIPFSDTQAEPITVVPIWRAPTNGTNVPAQLGPTQGPKAWTDAWKNLDLGHTLTPVKLEALKADVLPETVTALASGDTGRIRTIASSYNATERLVVAIAEPDIASKRLNVILIGTDAVGSITWKRAYRLDLSDPAYAVELAGVVSLGVLEGRWKATNRRGGDGTAARQDAMAPDPTAGSANVQFSVEFRGMSEWAEISRKISATPGVQYIDILGLSARGARVALNYPGGVERLADALARQGMTLRSEGARWVLAAQ